MQTGEKGLALIKHFEGLRLRAYQCSANTGIPPASGPAM
jgi:GH24 family phage-related lysozyme (muramidase)